MHLHDSIIVKELNSTRPELEVSRDELVLSCCREALECESAGDYEAARGFLADYWAGVGERPKLDGLGDEAKAELLLRAGALSGKIGRAEQIKGSQEMAKDLISFGSRIFDEIGIAEKVAEAQLELAICYWREGARDEARDTLKLAVDRNPEVESEQRLKSLVTLGIIESSASRFHEALRIYGDVAPLLSRNKNHLLRGSFHNQYALAYKNLGKLERRFEYIDRAFIEFSAAAYHFEQSGNIRYLALVETNLGSLFLAAKKPLEAHQHLNRARALLVKLRDKGIIAQVDETRALAFLAQGLYSQAETTVRGAVRTSEQGDEKLVLAEALITHGSALAGLERFERAYGQLTRAIQVATEADLKEKAGLAALTIVENLSSYVAPTRLREYFRDAESKLGPSPDPDTEERLGKSARKILAMFDSNSEESRSFDQTDSALELDDAIAAEASETAETVGHLEGEVLRYERELIQRALESVGGSVTRAARLLGITHQGLAFILNGRHQSLLAARTPIRRRRKSIFRPQ
ncbi:MAG TPA: helix-turn-helix domain-containing protein [Pyrinomonadaceae bacterium]|nr:helix-turn-helix domain-containing protein [Pyrinomonadaceae bacterium]